MNIWVVSRLWLLWRVLLWSLVRVSLVNMDTHLNVTIYVDVELVRIRVHTFLALVDNAKYFSKVVIPSCTHTSNTQSCSWHVWWYYVYLLSFLSSNNLWTWLPLYVFFNVQYFISLLIFKLHCFIAVQVQLSPFLP